MEMKFKYYALILNMNIHRNYYSYFYIIIIMTTNPQGPLIHNAYSCLVPMLILNWNSKVKDIFSNLCLKQTIFLPSIINLNCNSSNVLFHSVEQNQWSFKFPHSFFFFSIKF